MKYRIFISFVLFCLISVLIQSCIQTPHIPPTPPAPPKPIPIHAGYDRDVWSRLDDGLSVFPEVDFSNKEKGSKGVIQKRVNVSKEVKAYSDKIAACFKQKPIDFDDAEELVDDMISDCKGQNGLDTVIFKYISTLSFVVYEYQSFKDDVQHYKDLLKNKDKKAQALNYSKSNSGRLQNFFPGKNLGSEGIEKLIGSGISDLKTKMGKSFVKLSENNSFYSEEELLKVKFYCNGNVFFFSDLEDRGRDYLVETIVERPGPFYTLMEYEEKLPVYRPGEKAYVRAYCITQGQNSELEFTIYKVDPVSMLREKISFYDLKPPSTSKVMKKWKQNVKVKDSAFSFNYDFDDFFDPFEIVGCLEPIPLPPEDWEEKVSSIDSKYDIDLPIKEPGFYIVGMGDGQYTAYTPVLVTDLNIMTKYDGDLLLSYCDRTRIAKDKKEKLIFTIAREDEILHRSLAGKNDICAVRARGKVSSGFVFVSSGDHHAFSDIKPVPKVSLNRMTSYVYTERPLYRPGNKVMIKVISRKVNPFSGSFTVPADGKITVKVKDPQSNILKETELELNEFGTCNLDLQLDEEAALGDYKVVADGEGGICRFEVKEYRKAECEVVVNFNSRTAVAGDHVKVIVTGTYYHGKPLKNRNVEIVIKGREDKPISGKLNEYGQLTSEIDTRGLSPHLLYVTARVTDSSGRLFTGRGNIYLNTSGVDVRLKSSNGKTLSPAQKTEIEIKTRDNNDSDISSEVVLNVRREKISSGSILVDKVIVKGKKLKTDNTGRAVYNLDPDEEGEYKISVTALDSKGRKSTDEITIHVKKEEVPDKSEPTPAGIVISKKDYKPYETTEMKIKGSSEKNTFLCSLDTMKINSFCLVPEGKPYELKLSGESSISTLKINPNTLESGKLLSFKDKVNMTGNLLDVKISTPRKIYEPGETIRLGIDALKWNGESADFESSLAVVDKAVLNLSKIKNSNIQKSLFKEVHYDIPVETVFGVPYKVGVVGYRRIILKSYGGSGRRGLVTRYYGTGSGSKPKKRKNFKDTGYWNPGLVSGGNGGWNGEFKLPDDITAWQLRALAVTKDGKAGEGFSEIITARDFMVRLIFPRSFTEGDTAIISAIIENYSNKTKKGNVLFEYKNCRLLEGKLNQVIKVPADSSIRKEWKIKIDSTQPVVLSALASIGGSQGDGEERTIPVIPLGAENKIIEGGTLKSSKDIGFDIPNDVLLGSVSYQLDFQGSPKVANLISGLKYLVNYPYGCVEQTMSRFMPAMAAKNALIKLDVKEPELQKKIGECASKSLQKLYGYQHDDGGWGWWKNDKTNSFLTAYVIYGFSVTKNAGYEIDENIVKKGLKCLAERIWKEKDLQMKSFMVMAYSYWEKPEKEWIKDLFEKRANIGSFGLGALLITCKKTGNSQCVSGLIRSIEGKAEKQNGVTYWNTRGMKLTSGRIQSTAFMLRALLMADPNNDLILDAVNFLLQNQKGGRWSQTKDSAAATEALAAFLEKNKVTGKSGAKGSVTINNQEAKAFAMEKDFFRKMNVLKCDMEYFKKGRNRVTLKVEDDKRYGYSSILKYRSEKLSKTMVDNGLKIIRNYELMKRDESGKMTKAPLSKDDLMTRIEQGDIIKVNIKLTHSLTKPRYLMLEDYFPAGFEIIEEEGKEGKGKPYSHFESRDEKAVFFITEVPKKEVLLSYKLRAETVGVFSANPANAELMYHPHINGHSAISKLKINDKTVRKRKRNNNDDDLGLELQ